MKLAETRTELTSVEMHYSEKAGYWVTHVNGSTVGSVQFIQSREEAESWFIWNVGYPEWERESKRAFREKKEQWLKDHATLASVGATDLSP